MLYSWKEDLILRHNGPWPKHLAMPRNASLVPERGHVVAFSWWAWSYIQQCWSTIAFRPLVVVMTCAQCKRCPGLKMAGSSNRHLASPIRSLYLWKFAHTCHAFSHKTCYDDFLCDLGFPKRNATILLVFTIQQCFFLHPVCSNSNINYPTFAGVTFYGLPRRFFSGLNTWGRFLIGLGWCVCMLGVNSY